MRKSDYPHINNIELWDKIVSHKHQPAKDKLLSVREKVNIRYKFYEENTASLDKILPLSPEEWQDVKSELISCYGDNVELKKTRQELFNNLSVTKRTKCPYCMLNRPNTLEHYFNKDDYPEFSVYIPNLVPCCSECNTEKSTSVFDAQNNRNYIHFYHDRIPEEQFLYVRFSFSDSDNVPVVNITLSFGEKNYYSDLIERHFSNLSLISKYHNAILDRVAPILEEIRVYKEEGTSQEKIAEALRIKLETLSTHYGNNYWETCIYEGLLNSSGFLEQLLFADTYNNE